MKITTDAVVFKIKLEKDIVNSFAGNSCVSVIGCACLDTKTTNMDSLKSELSSEKDYSHDGLIVKFDNLDLNEKGSQNLLDLDIGSINEGKSSSLDSVTDKNETSENSLTDIKNKILTVSDIESKSRSIKKYEYSETIDLINISASSLPHTKFSGKMSHLKYEDDLTASFSNLGLDEKHTNAKANNKGNNCLPESSLRDKECEKIDPSNQLFKLENNDLLCEQEIRLAPGASSSLDENNLLGLATKKVEISSESKLLHIGDDHSDEELTERSPNVKISKNQQTEKKIRAGRTEKVAKAAGDLQLKKIPQLHMCGGMIINTSSSETCNRTTEYYNLAPVSDASYQNNFRKLSPPSSLPVFYDQNIIDPIKHGVQVQANNCETSHCGDDLLGDILSPALSCSDTNYWPSLPVECDMLSGAENQKNIHSNQYMTTFSSLLDIFNCDTPNGENTTCPELNSRSTTPESGYGSPGNSPFSDDCSDPYKHRDQSPSDYSNYLKGVFPVSPCTAPVHEQDESVNNLDWSMFDDLEKTLFSGHESTGEEDKKKINEIKNELQKCEHLCNLKDSSVLNTLEMPSSINPGQLDSVCDKGFLSGVNTSHLQQCSTSVGNPQQKEPLAYPKVTPQLESVNVNSSPQVILICVPYNVQAVDKTQKKFPPILPKPKGQSPKERLQEKLDRGKINRHLYEICEKIKNNGENAIYIEDEKNRQTNLHIAVKNQNTELAFCILEVHKKSKKNMSAVNCRDIHKKTALQYAISNAMKCGAPEACILFAEYFRKEVNML